MVEKNLEDTIEFFVPKLGLEVGSYIAAGQKQGIHHLGRYWWAIEVLKTMRPGRLIDVACGAGYGSHILAKHLPEFEIIGGDYDPRAVKYARTHYQAPELPNLRYHQVDIVTWTDLRNQKSVGHVDYIVSFDTIEHLLHREITLVHFAEFLAEDGALLFSTPCGRSANLLNPGWEHHKIEYSYRYLYNLMRRFFGEVLIPDDRSLPALEYWEQVINHGQSRYLLRNNPMVCRQPIHHGLGWFPEEEP